jgi:hypothetical protein
MSYLLHKRYQGARARAGAIWKLHQLQAVLWFAWTLLVAAVGCWQWRADALAHHPLNLLALAIHCAAAGLVGLVAMTWLEMRLEPWRFLN